MDDDEVLPEWLQTILDDDDRMFTRCHEELSTTALQQIRDEDDAAKENGVILSHN